MNDSYTMLRQNYTVVGLFDKSHEKFSADISTLLVIEYKHFFSNVLVGMGRE
jgi:hypothetical protein